MAGAVVSGARGARVQTVYILPMSGGLDNYLAEWLAHGSAIHVTTDPARADAVLTDHLGEDFERKLDQILPGDSDDDDSSDAASDDSGQLQLHYTGGRYRGTIFLVDAKSRQVLWSDYEKPPTYRTPQKLNGEARKIAKKLETGLSQ